MFDWIKYYSLEYLKVHKLRNSLNKENYNKICIEFLKINEGFSLKSYEDSKGHWTIGFGLLLKKKNAKNLNPIAIQCFHKVLNIDLLSVNLHSLKISPDDAFNLLSYFLNLQLKYIKNKIPFFNFLPLNYQIALQSIVYNRPRIFALKNWHKFLSNLKIIAFEDDFSFNKFEAYKFCIIFLENNNFANDILRRKFYESAMLSNSILDLFVKLPLSVLNKYFNCDNFSEFQLYLFLTNNKSTKLPNIQDIYKISLKYLRNLSL